MSDQSAALAMLRERFPEGEGWHVGVRSPDYHGYEVWADHGELTTLTESAQDGYLAAAQWLIASWDAATHAAQVRALVEAAERAEEALARIGSALGPWGQYDTRRETAHLLARSLATALTALPASLRGKGGERG